MNYFYIVINIQGVSHHCQVLLVRQVLELVVLEHGHAPDGRLVGGTLGGEGRGAVAVAMAAARAEVVGRVEEVRGRRFLDHGGWGGGGGGQWAAVGAAVRAAGGREADIGALID